MPKKDNKPNPEYDSERETRVLLEQIRSEVKVVAEQHGSIREDLTTIKSELGTVKMALMESSVNIKSVKVRQEKMDQKLDTALDNHEKRISKLEEKVNI